MIIKACIKVLFKTIKLYELKLEKLQSKNQPKSTLHTRSRASRSFWDYISLKRLDLARLGQTGRSGLGKHHERA